MANAQKIDLCGKTVMLRREFYPRLFLCEGGRGCNPKIAGDKIFGKYLENTPYKKTGKSFKNGVIRSYWIEKILN